MQKPTLKLGRAWIRADRTGIMGWTGKRNFYWIWIKN